MTELIYNGKLKYIIINDDNEITISGLHDPNDSNYINVIVNYC
jgi:hypothetical protein